MNSSLVNRIGAVIALLVGSLLILTGPASAQPGYSEGGPAVELSSSTSNDTITAIGSGFVPGEPVTGTVFSDPIDLGTKNADAAGSVSFTFSVKNLTPGEHRVVLTAPSGSASAVFTVSAGAAAGVSDETGTTTSGSASNGLAFTGSDLVVPLAVVGMLLLAGGGIAVISNRSRSRSRSRA